jgi:hypothetical protein
MKSFDVDKARSEETHSLGEFLDLYNQNLPVAYTPATVALLEEFKTAHPTIFKSSHGTWSLGAHRKQVMDWLQLAPFRAAQ